MKASRTLLFICCVLLGLAFISLIFPKDGIKLEFPSLTEALTPAKKASTRESNPEADMKKKLEAASNVGTVAEFSNFCRTSPSRIYMPGNDSTYLDDFFKALEEAMPVDSGGKNIPLRIIHYGDSQLEGDRMTNVLREYYQSTFGGMGPGMLPAVPLVAQTQTVSQTVTPASLQHYMPYGNSDWRASHKRYGPMAIMSRVDGNASFSITCVGKDEYKHNHSFNKISVAVMGSGSVSANANGQTYSLTPSDATTTSLRFFTAELPSTASKVTVNVSGNMDVYSIMLDGKTGVSMDNVSQRGSSGTVFSSIERNTIAPFFQHENVRLIIFQFGGNSVPYLETTSQIAHYKDLLRTQLKFLKEIAPKAKILFVGPADMSTNIKGEEVSYPMMKNVVNMLHEVSNEEGVAFWNMYSVMGGDGSMVQWVKKNLAGPDYVHFTRAGAQYMSSLLFNTMQLYYKFYRLRMGDTSVQFSDDSASEAPGNSSTNSGQATSSNTK